jgi:3-oxoacyl-[acyl-carrier protein] reductase
MNKKIVVFGGSSGLAKKALPNLNNYTIEALSSKDCDVRDYESVKEKIKTADVVIYFSVINYDNLITNLVYEEVNHAIDVNIKGFINTLKACGTEFKEKKSGKVIYISSILSSDPIRGTGMYSASKAFCDTLVKVFAKENGKYGITCNSIQLGYFDGGLTYKVPESVLDTVKKQIPVNRFGDTAELASLIDQIIKNDYLNGSVIKLSGGL